jgi:hypothetical protein
MALAQCCGVICLGARKLSWCRLFIAGSCACPGAGLSTVLGKWLRVMPVRLAPARTKSIRTGQPGGQKACPTGVIQAGMTNNLPLLSVLAQVSNYFLWINLIWRMLISGQLILNEKPS